MNPIAWVVLAWFVVAAMAIGLALLYRRRGLKPGTIMPSGQMRREFFRHLGSPDVSPVCPARPPNLDCRLDDSVEAELRRLAPAIKDNWQQAWDGYQCVLGSIDKELDEIDSDNGWYELLSPARCALIAAWRLEAEVNNGGFDQFFLNSSGDGAAATPKALRLLGQEKFASLVEQANAQFPQGPPVSRALRLHQMERLPDQASKVWSALNSEFYDLPSIDLDVTVPFILANRDEFFKPPPS